MDRNTIFSKTESGLREVQSRTPGFPSRLRQLLIMIDGHKRFDDLLGLQPDSDELSKQILQLIELKLVNNIGVDDLRPPVQRPAPAAPTVAPLITPTVAPAMETAAVATVTMTNSALPSASARQKVRRIISMTDQAYLSNKLEMMLSDVYDVLTTQEEFQFCIDRWQKALKDAGHTDMAAAYLSQVKSAMRG